MINLPCPENLPQAHLGRDSDFLIKYIDSSMNCLKKTLHDQTFQHAIMSLSQEIADVIKAGGKVLLAGNGGSASDAQHFACELVSRFLMDSHPYPALSLATDTSALTAISNDYGYEHVFSRQLSALASPQDLFIAITTSGRSKNILNALNEARKQGLSTCAFTGANGLSDSVQADTYIKAESTLTPHIQELHGIAIHLICALVESNLQIKN